MFLRHFILFIFQHFLHFLHLSKRGRGDSDFTNSPILIVSVLFLYSVFFMMVHKFFPQPAYKIYSYTEDVCGCGCTVRQILPNYPEAFELA
jgi:hypothetical protein